MPYCSAILRSIPIKILRKEKIDIPEKIQIKRKDSNASKKQVIKCSVKVLESWLRIGESQQELAIIS